MSFLQGVTNFLESVDQKAGELAEARRVAASSGGSNEVDEQGDAEDFEIDEEDTTGALPASFPSRAAAAAHFTTPPFNSEGSKQPTHDYVAQIAALLETQNMMEKRHEAAMLERQRAMKTLESSYASLQEYTKSLDHRVQELTENLDSANRHAAATATQLKDAQLQHEVREQQLAALRHDMALLHDEVQALTEQRDLHAAEVARALASKRLAEDALHQVSSELSDYRRKSKVAIDERDATIAELRLERDAQMQPRSSGSLPSGFDPAAHAQEVSTLAAAVADAEKRVAELTTENRQLLAHRSDLEASLETLRLQCDDRERSLRVELKDSESSFEQERRSHTETRKALTAVRDELEVLRGKLSAAQLSLQQSASGTEDTKRHDALEVRVRELADLLMEKQAALEAKRSETDQWRTRFEVSQQRLREAELVQTALNSRCSSSAGGTRSVFIGGDDDADAGDISKTRLLRSLSRRGGWGEGVVTVAKSLDRVSLRTGSILRHNSLLRVGLIVYVMLLHVWVFFAVTLSGQMPEAKSDVGPKLS